MLISRAVRLAAALGCTKSDPASLEKCLVEADPEKITLNQFEVLTQAGLLATTFVPVVDGDFLPDKVEVGVCVVCVCVSVLVYISGFSVKVCVCVFDKINYGRAI